MPVSEYSLRRGPRRYAAPKPANCLIRRDLRPSALPLVRFQVFTYGTGCMGWPKFSPVDMNATYPDSSRAVQGNQPPPAVPSCFRRKSSPDVLFCLEGTAKQCPFALRFGYSGFICTRPAPMDNEPQ